VALGGERGNTHGRRAGSSRARRADFAALVYLRERLDDILRRDVRERMKAYAVRRDRAGCYGHCGDYLCDARPLSQFAHALDSGGGHSRGVAAGKLHAMLFSRKEPHRYNVASRQLLVGQRAALRGGWSTTSVMPSMSGS